ncbi:SGNH/GDSL hydrolase family protein [Paenibacillus elgii]|uniref:SGNH/GDSL hydrolase family protein n=1 Tax=Paenibacillus elgii TaxID=189691 RepID=UPI0013D583CD|nr:hypothetical protein [Paenibacillus elgii]
MGYIFIPKGSGATGPAVEKIDKSFGYNISSGLSQYRKALQASATSQVRIIWIGDSLTQQAGAAGYAQVLRSKLQARYGNSSIGYLIPDNFGGGAGWGFNNNQGGFALQALKFTGGATVSEVTGTVSLYNPRFMFRKQVSGGGTAKIFINNVEKGTVDCSGGNGTASDWDLSVSIAQPATNGLGVRIVPDGNGIVEFNGVITETATNSGVMLHRIASPGARASHFASQNAMIGWKYFSSPHLVGLCLGANDIYNVSAANLKSTLQQWKADMGTIINYWKGRGSDVLLVPWFRPADSWTTFWPELVEAYYELADQFNCGLVDVYRALGMSYELLANVYGYLGDGPDPIHPTGGQKAAIGAGHAHVARIIEPNVILK